MSFQEMRHRLRELRIQLEEGEAKRQQMLKTVSRCLNILVERQYMDESKIGEWDVRYQLNLAQERGYKAGTFPSADGSFYIAVEPSITEDEIHETMAHETIHLIQHFKGDVKHDASGMVNWKGQMYTRVPPSQPEYDEQPWEEEAYRLGRELVEVLEHEGQ